MADNPFVAGTFYSDPFATDQPDFDFGNPLRDQRQTILMEIEGIQQTTVLAFSNIQTDPMFSEFAYYYFNTLGTLSALSALDEYNDANPIRWSFIGGAPAPAYYVMTDELGQFVYVTTSFSSPLTISSSHTKPTQYTEDQSRFVGPYIEMIGEDGHSIYRMTANSTPGLTTSLNRDEPLRTDGVWIQQGHPHAFRSGRTYLPSLIEIGNVDTQVPTSTIGFAGVASPKVGIIKIAILDEQLDFLTQQDWDSRAFTLRIGSTDEPISNYPIAMRGQTESATWDEDFISLSVRDAGIQFDSPVLPLDQPGGLGDVETRIDNILLGAIDFMEPELIDEVTNKYQVGIESVDTIASISQGGVFLTSLGDFPGGLDSWNPTQQEVDDGNYRTDVGMAQFKLAGPPGGRVLVLVTKTPNPNTTTSATADVLIGAILRAIPDANIDTNSFDRHRDLYPANAHANIAKETPLRQVLNELLPGVGSVVGINRLNEIYIKALWVEAPAAYLDQNSGIVHGSLKRTPPPKGGSAHRFGHRKIHTVFTESDLLEGAPGFLKPFIFHEYRIIDEGPYPLPISSRFPSGKLKRINTAFTNENHERDSERSAQLLSYSEWAFRDVFTIAVWGISWQIKIGDTIVLEYPRWGLDVPRSCVVVGITERSPTLSAENLTTLKMIG